MLCCSARHVGESAHSSFQSRKGKAGVGPQDGLQVHARQPFPDQMVCRLHIQSLCLHLPSASRPSVPLNLQNTALSRLVISLEGLPSYHLNRNAANRKRKRAARADLSASKRIKTSTVDTPQINASTIVDNEDDPEAVNTPPDILAHLTIGINQVTKRLEAQARAYRDTDVTPKTTDGFPDPPPIKIVFVCRADVDPPLLIAHIPTLIASCNSSPRTSSDSTTYPPIKLVCLPLGAEMTLAESTGLRRVSIIALDVSFPIFSSRTLSKTQPAPYARPEIV